MEEIQQWLNDFPKSTCLLVIGKKGVGKTKIVKDILEQHDYHIHYFTTTNFNKKGIIRDYFNKIIQSSNIWIMMKQHKSPIIVIDDLEGISLNDRGSINEIIDMIKYIKTCKKQIPVICIGDDTYFKKQKDLTKLCDVIYIQPPTQKELIDYIKNLSNKYQVTVSKSTVVALLQECQQDYHRLENLLKYMCLEKKSSFKINDINKIIESTDKKQIHINLYEATKKLLYDEVSVEETLKLFYEEKTLLPLMIHQNYHIIKDKNLLAKISDIISLSNILETFLYQKNEWDLLNYYGFLSCYLPTKLLKQKHLLQKEIIYTKMLNKISLKYTYIQKLREKTIKNSEYYFDSTLQKYNIKRLYKLQNENEATKYNLTLKQINDMIKYI